MLYIPSKVFCGLGLSQQRYRLILLLPLLYLPAPTLVLVQYNKCWSRVMLLARGWCHWRQMEAALAPVLCWGSAHSKKLDSDSVKNTTLGRFLVILRISATDLGLCQINFLATRYELLFVNNLGPSSCFPHILCASAWVLFNFPIWLKH